VQYRLQQRTATHCNTLQHTATHYNTLLAELAEYIQGSCIFFGQGDTEFSLLCFPGGSEPVSVGVAYVEEFDDLSDCDVRGRETE